MKILRVYKSIEYVIPNGKNNYDILVKFENYMIDKRDIIDLTVEIKNRINNMVGCASINSDGRVSVFIQSNKDGEIGDDIIDKDIFNSDYIIERIFTEESKDGGF